MSSPDTTATTATNVATSPTATTVAPATAPPVVDQNPPGDIPDNQAFVAVTPVGGTPVGGTPVGGFTVNVPEGWARSDDSSGATFSDKYNSVHVESRLATSAPTVESATATEVPAVAQAGHNVAGVKVSAVTRAAGPVVLITYEADSPVNDVTGKIARLAVERYEFWHQGTEVVVTLSGPVGADNVDPWRTVTDSLRWA
jgi:hypothetical protein